MAEAEAEGKELVETKLLELGSIVKNLKIRKERLDKLNEQIIDEIEPEGIEAEMEKSSDLDIAVKTGIGVFERN